MIIILVVTNLLTFFLILSLRGDLEAIRKNLEPDAGDVMSWRDRMIADIHDEIVGPVQKRDKPSES